MRPARHLVACALLASVLLAAGAAPVSGQGGLVTVNLLWSEDHGCTPDRVTPADMKVTVRLGSTTLIEAYAPQQDRPEFAVAVQVPRPEGTERLTVRIEEGEPAGLLLLGTDFLACDASPNDEANVHGLDWDGSRQTVDVRGDGDDATAFRMQLGSDPPDQPEALVAGTTTTSATIAWDADATGRALRHHVAAGHYGPRLRSASAAAGQETVDGLCDGMQYAMRVLREAADWTISSRDVTFTTDNAPPAAPRIVQAEREGESVSLAWEEATPHDLERYDIHAGPDATFVPGPGNRVGRGPTPSTHDVRWTASVAASDTHVKVVAVDKGGLSATSPAFRVGDPAAETRLRGFPDCGAGRAPSGGPDGAGDGDPQGGTSGTGSAGASSTTSRASPALALAPMAAALLALAWPRRRDPRMPRPSS